MRSHNCRRYGKSSVHNGYKDKSTLCVWFCVAHLVNQSTAFYPECSKEFWAIKSVVGSIFHHFDALFEDGSLGPALDRSRT